MGTDKPVSISPGQDQSDGLWAGPEGLDSRATTPARELDGAAGRGGTTP